MNHKSGDLPKLQCNIYLPGFKVMCIFVLFLYERVYKCLNLWWLRHFLIQQQCRVWIRNGGELNEEEKRFPLTIVIYNNYFGKHTDF